MTLTRPFHITAGGHTHLFAKSIPRLATKSIKGTINIQPFFESLEQHLTNRCYYLSRFTQGCAVPQFTCEATMLFCGPCSRQCLMSLAITVIITKNKGVHLTLHFKTFHKRELKHTFFVSYILACSLTRALRFAMVGVFQ